MTVTDKVIFLLAATVCTAVLMFVGSMIWRMTGPPTEQGASLMADILKTMLTVVTLYVGKKLGDLGQKLSEKKPDEQGG